MNRRAPRLIIASILLALGCGGREDATGPRHATLVLATASLANGAPGAEYSDKLEAAGGNGNYAWALTGGTLPNDLSLNTATGEISGTPTDAGTRIFQVQVASGDGQTAQRSLSITVEEPPVLSLGELCSDHPSTAIATFEDANLEARVRLSFPGEDLTCGRISRLMVLSASSQGVVSLVGMQNLTALRQLFLWGNSITDLTPLGGLIGLEELWLSSNSLSDIGALSELTRLQGLYLYFNSITDVTPLRGLRSLQGLYLQFNRNLAEIEPLLDNIGLVAGDLVDLRSTSVTCQHICFLEANGVTVISDCE